MDRSSVVVLVLLGRRVCGTLYADDVTRVGCRAASMPTVGSSGVERIGVLEASEIEEPEAEDGSS